MKINEVDFAAMNKIQCRICKAVLSVENLTPEIQQRVVDLNCAAEIADIAFRTTGLLELTKDHLLMHARAGAASKTATAT